MTGETMTGGRRILALVLLAGVFVMEGYDLNAMALAVPRLKGALGLEPAEFGWVFSALLVGIGIGGATLAPLGDRIGRRPLIVFGCLGVALSTLATALAESIPTFLVWRFLTGFALGACLPNVSALSAELAPERLRATLMSVVSAGIPLGLALAGLLTPAVVAMGGWQGLFIVPGLFAAILALLLGFTLSPGVPEAAPGASARSRAPQLELFRAPWLFPFAVFAAALSLNAMNLYLLNSWLPTVLPQAGFSLDDAARVAGVVQLAGLVIGIGVSVLIDRWRPGLTLVLAFGLMALCFLAIGASAPDARRWTLLLMVGMGGASAGGMALPALCAYLFPPRLLSSAVGMGVLVARIGAFLGPLLGQAMLSASITPNLFLAAAAGPAALCALVSLWVPAALAVRKQAEAPPVKA
jgi:AAHS family 4-hydroxybenzoate transporter-like MFS transporter